MLVRSMCGLNAPPWLSEVDEASVVSVPIVSAAVVPVAGFGVRSVVVTGAAIARRSSSRCGEGEAGDVDRLPGDEARVVEDQIRARPGQAAGALHVAVQRAVEHAEITGRPGIAGIGGDGQTVERDRARRGGAE